MTKKESKRFKGQVEYDIVFNILKLLPAKFLMRVKCVCKTWLNLICNPYFAESHHKKSLKRHDASSILFYFKCESSQILLIPTTPEAIITTALPTHRFNINESKPCSEIVNGLTCLYQKRKNQLFLLNVTTGERLLLPQVSLFRNYGRSKFLLGFDPIGKKHKVLHFEENFVDGRSYVVNCEVMTLGEKTWRRIECPKYLFPKEESRMRFYGLSEKVVNGHGRIFWRQSRTAISYFDIKEETFGFYAVKNNESVQQLVQLGDRLGLLLWYSQYKLSTFMGLSSDEVWTWSTNDMCPELGGRMVHGGMICSTKTIGEFLIATKKRGFQILFYDSKANSRSEMFKAISIKSIKISEVAGLSEFDCAVGHHVENILSLANSFEEKKNGA